MNPLSKYRSGVAAGLLRRAKTVSVLMQDGSAKDFPVLVVDPRLARIVSGEHDPKWMSMRQKWGVISSANRKSALVIETAADKDTVGIEQAYYECVLQDHRLCLTIDEARVTGEWDRTYQCVFAPIDLTAPVKRASVAPKSPKRWARGSYPFGGSRAIDDPGRKRDTSFRYCPECGGVSFRPQTAKCSCGGTRKFGPVGAQFSDWHPAFEFVGARCGACEKYALYKVHDARQRKACYLPRWRKHAQAPIYGDREAPAEYICVECGAINSHLRLPVPKPRKFTTFRAQQASIGLSDTFANVWCPVCHDTVCDRVSQSGYDGRYAVEYYCDNCRQMYKAEYVLSEVTHKDRKGTEYSVYHDDRRAPQHRASVSQSDAYGTFYCPGCRDVECDRLSCEGSSGYLDFEAWCDIHGMFSFTFTASKLRKVL